MNPNSTSSQNMALVALTARLIAPHLEKKYGIVISSDDLLEYLAEGLVAWHVFLKGVAPYANRIFDRFFPPAAQPPSQETTK